MGPLLPPEAGHSTATKVGETKWLQGATMSPFTLSKTNLDKKKCFGFKREKGISLSFSMGSIQDDLSCDL